MTEEINVENCKRCQYNNSGTCSRFNYIINPTDKKDLDYFIVDSEDCFEYKGAKK